MLTLFGYELGTLLQGSTFLAILGLIAAIYRVYIVGAPDRARVKNEGDASLRTALMNRVTKLEETQVADRERHAEERLRDREACDKTTDELRERIRDQDKMIDGLQRQLIMFQVASARALPLGEASPEIEQMLASLHPLFAMHSGPKSETLKSAEEAHHATGVTVEQVHQDEASK